MRATDERVVAGEEGGVMKKWPVWIACVVVLLAVATWPMPPWPCDHRLTSANCPPPVPGPSPHKSHATLGPGWRPFCRFGIPPGEHPEYWSDATCSICIDFDDQDRVIRVQYGSNPDPVGEAWRRYQPWHRRWWR